MYITNENELLERIKKIINTLARGKKAIFARAIGVNERYVARYIQQNRGDWFMGHLKAICKAYPTISEKWLYSGTGEMLVPERPNPIRSVTNAKDLLIGDLLWEFFSLKDASLAEVKKQCNFDDTFNQVMESSRYPTFTELETLHKVYDLNVTYLFTNRKEDMEGKTISKELEKLTDELVQTQIDNKQLNAKLINALEENSELNKELHKAKESAKTTEKGTKTASGKTFAKSMSPAKN